MGKAHLIERLVLSMLIIGCSSFVYGQDVDALLDLIQLGKMDSAEVILQDLSYEYPGHPGVRYARAIMQDDALVAAGLYKDIVRNHGDSQYAADALMHLGEYYYAQGLYIQSREFFSRLIRFNPEYPEIVNAVNLSLRAGIASRLMDSVYYDLSTIIEKYPDLAFDIPEELDLTRLPDRTPRVSQPLDSETNVAPLRSLGEGVGSSNELAQGNFVLQAGAFGNFDNARRLADQIESIGYKTEIKERMSGGKILFMIYVGDYQTKTAALSVADMLEAALGIPSFPVENN